MEYCSQYLWEKGLKGKYNPVSVVIQQVKQCRKSILLACVCEGKSEGEAGITESGYFTERLVEWFHNEFLKRLCMKNREEETKEALCKEMEKICCELAAFGKKREQVPKLHYWGILLMDNYCWLFFRGDCRGYLLNKRFNSKHIRLLGEGTDYVCLCGKVQRHIGILLCTPNFTEGLTGEELLEVLFVDKEVTEAKMEKRLKELWQESVRRGITDSAGAIYIRIQ